MQWQIALSGAIPAIVAMWFVDRLDRKRPEPARTRRLVAFVGMLSVIPAIVLEMIAMRTLGESVEPRMTYQGASFHAFVIAAAIEEACKILVVYWVVWRRPEFDERMDGIVYASRAGLGFALVENVLYLMQEATLGGQLQTWVLRAVLAVPGHAMWTGMIGAMAARRRFDGRGLGLVGGYLLAVAFHGAYDLCAFLQAPLTFEGHSDIALLMMPALLALTVGAFFVLRSQARMALKLDDADAALGAANAARQPGGAGCAAQHDDRGGNAGEHRAAEQEHTRADRRVRETREPSDEVHGTRGRGDDRDERRARDQERHALGRDRPGEHDEHEHRDVAAGARRDPAAHPQIGAAEPREPGLSTLTTEAVTRAERTDRHLGDGPPRRLHRECERACRGESETDCDPARS